MCEFVGLRQTRPPVPLGSLARLSAELLRTAAIHESIKDLDRFIEVDALVDFNSSVNPVVLHDNCESHCLAPAYAHSRLGSQKAHP